MIGGGVGGTAGGGGGGVTFQRQRSYSETLPEAAVPESSGGVAGSPHVTAANMEGPISFVAPEFAEETIMDVSILVQTYFTQYMK